MPWAPESVVPVIDYRSFAGIIPGVQWGPNIEIRQMKKMFWPQGRGTLASVDMCSVFDSNPPGVSEEYEIQRGQEPGKYTLRANALKDG